MPGKQPAHGLIGRLARARSASMAMEFAFVFPILLVLTIGVLELGIVFFGFHRAGEATRSISRLFLVDPPLTSFATMPVTCPGGATCDDTKIQNTVDSVQGLMPGFQITNLQIDYRASGLAGAGPAGLVMPVMNVRIVGLNYNFFILNSLIPGFPDSISFPPFATSQLMATMIE
jgi:TadE-like protein